jgi:hypothetical protein
LRVVLVVDIAKEVMAVLVAAEQVDSVLLQVFL